MKSGPALDDLVARIVETCRAGLEPDALRAAVLPRLRKAVPVDAVWWATVDPATLLYTHAYREELPSDSGPYFVENEFLRDDVNKWTELAHDRSGVRTLAEATDGVLALSPRYRDIFEPLGLADELRAVLRARGAVWGFMCLHRESGAVFSPQEQSFIQRIAPHLAEGVRLGLLVQCAARDDLVESPGLILLAPDNSVVGRNPAADRWLEELGWQEAGEIPIEIHSLAARLRRADASTNLSPLRVRTRSGRWIILQASWMSGEERSVVAVIIQEATPEEVAPIVMSAYGLSEQERAVSGLVFQGESTHVISQRLHIAEHTVQDHLKSIFDKTGVRSRRELVASVFRQRYLPRMKAGDQRSPSGYFAEPARKAH
ncbi:MAG: helix-turn-helix transcriptional regulator [Candidatus Dormiibacterota bacterium]